MNDSSDELQTHVLLVVAGVVALVLAGVLAIAIKGGSATTAARSGRSGVLAGPSADAPQGRIRFNAGSVALPADAEQVPAPIVDAVRADSASVVLVFGCHEDGVAPGASAVLADKRAQAVRHALEADGVPANRLLIDEPSLARGNGHDAGCVELRVR